MEAVALTILAVLGVLGVLVTSAEQFADCEHAQRPAQPAAAPDWGDETGGRKKLSDLPDVHCADPVLLVSFALLIAVPAGVQAGYALADFIATYLNIEPSGVPGGTAGSVHRGCDCRGIPLAAGYFPINRGAKTYRARAISEDRPGGQPSSSGLFDQARRPR